VGKGELVFFRFGYFFAQFFEDVGHVFPIKKPGTMAEVETQYLAALHLSITPGSLLSYRVDYLFNNWVV
jgi:hypothetical protein